MAPRGLMEEVVERLDRPLAELPADSPAPELLAWLVLAERGEGGEPVRAALAASLADAFEMLLDRRDLQGAWDRALGPDAPRTLWHRQEAAAAVLPGLFPVPAGFEGPLADLPARLSGAPEEVRAALARWAGWLEWRRRAFPRHRRVWFPTTREVLRLAAWATEPVRGCPALSLDDGVLLLLDADARPEVIDGRSYELAAALAREAACRGLDPGPVAASAEVARDGRLGGVAGWSEKARAIDAWRRWHHRGAGMTLLVARSDAAEAPAGRCRPAATLEQALEPYLRRTRFAGLRLPAERTRLAFRLRVPADPRLLDDPHFPPTRFEDARGRDLADWIADEARTVPEVLVAGPGGVGKSVSVLHLYRAFGHVALFDLAGLTPEHRIDAWLAEECGGPDAWAAFRTTRGAVALLDGLDELDVSTVRERVEQLRARLLGRASLAWVCRDEREGRLRLADYAASIPLYSSRPLVTRSRLLELGVSEEAAEAVVPAPGAASLALARLALAVAEDRRGDPVVEWPAIVDRAENPGIADEEIRAIEEAGARWTTRPGPLVLDPAAAASSIFLESRDDGTVVFRHDTWAGLYAARHLLRTAELPPEFRGLRWAEALRWTAAELARRPHLHRAWSPRERARLLSWVARIEQDRAGRAWRRWLERAREADEVGARPGRRVVEAVHAWREERRFVDAVRDLRAVLEDPEGVEEGRVDDWRDEARLLLCRVLTEAGEIGAAIDAVFPLLRRLLASGAPPASPEELVGAIAGRRGEPPTESLRTAMHAVGALAEALSWAGAHRVAASLHGAVADYFASVYDDDERARSRQVNALLAAAEVGDAAARDEAERLRDERIGRVSTTAHDFFRWLIDARLGRPAADARVPLPLHTPYFEVRDLHARALVGEETWQRVAGVAHAANRQLEAAGAWARAGRKVHVLEVLAAHDAAVAPLGGAAPTLAPERWAVWTSGADPALATWRGRRALLERWVEEGDLLRVAAHLPPF